MLAAAGVVTAAQYVETPYPALVPTRVAPPPLSPSTAWGRITRLPEVSPAPAAGRVGSYPVTAQPDFMRPALSSTAGTLTSTSGELRALPPTADIVWPPPAQDPPPAPAGHDEAEDAAAPADPSSTYRWDAADPRLAPVAQRVTDTIERGFQLANKGALYSARAEFRQALATLAQALDALHGVTAHSQALSEGQLALEEAADFLPTAGGLDGQVDVALVAATHRSPVLDGAPATGLPALLAVQQYYAFAQQRFAAAVGGAAVGSRALYALGKVHMAIAQDQPQNQLDLPRAMAFHQAALTAQPENYEAANELGVLLARFGQFREARDVLQQSVASRAMRETWHNLVIVHQQLGEHDLAQRAAAQMQLAAAGEADPPQADQPAEMVQWVPPQSFVEMNPGAAAPSPAATPPPRAAAHPFPSIWPW